MLHPAPRRMLRHASKVGLSALVALLTVAAPAQTKPWEVNMDRVRVATFGANLGETNTFLVPGVNLMVSAYSDVWSQAKSGDANAQAHAKVYVKGLDKALVQDLAKKIQDDFVGKLRAAGYTVLTYDDVKDLPDVIKQGRESPDAKWGLPTNKKDSNTFIVATPTDAQAFDRPIQGPTWPLRHIAKEKKLMVLVPDLSFVTPQVYGENTSGYKRAEIAIKTEPTLRLVGAMYWGGTDRGNANIQVQEHGKRLAAENAGVLKKLSEDKTSFTASWGRSSVDYLFTLDQAAFSDGILRVSYALNTMVVDKIKHAHK
ncbi:MAG: hypothetical protein JWM32_1424 [Verrucomicrobia bacterium]|nr:hypothetical protein [Verrucomicrobiota bacterium]